MSDFQKLISGYFDGALSEDEALELRQSIKETPANAREFMRAALLHNCVYEYIAGIDAKGDSGNLGDAHILPAIHDAEPAAEPREAPRSLEHVVYPTRRVAEEPVVAPVRKSSGKRWLIAAGILVPLVAVGLWYLRPVLPPNVPSIPLASTPTPPPIPVASPTFAVVGRAIDAQWVTTSAESIGAASDAPPTTAPSAMAVGTRLTAGAYELRTGYAQVKFDSGAAVVVRGPAKFEVGSAMRVRMVSGSLTTDVPAEARGFTVDVPAAAVVDLGTEIGVAVVAGHETHVEVFKGKAEVQLESAGGVGTNQVLTPAKAVRVDAVKSTVEEAAPQPLAFTRDGQLDEIAKAAAAEFRWRAYAEKMRQDPSLVGYYIFGGAFQTPEKLQNFAVATAGEYDGQMQKVAWDAGRFPNHAAMRFNGSDARVALTIDAPLQSFTVAAWVNLRKFDQNYSAILMSNGSHERNDLCHIQFSQVNAKPAVEVGIPNDIAWTNYYFHTNEIIAKKGAWQFVTVIYDGAARSVSCWLDGTCVETHALSAKSAAVLFGEAQIGNWNGSRDEDKRAMDGRMDEMAIWKRALRPEEVQAMYEAGKPAQQ